MIMNEVELVETSNEIAVVEPKRSRHLWLRVLVLVRPARGRRRVWDRIQQLEMDLAAANQRIIETEDKLFREIELTDSLGNDLADSREVIHELQRRLTVAIDANDANSHRVSVTFERDIDDDDHATQPVPIIELLDDGVIDMEDVPVISMSTTGTFRVTNVVHGAPFTSSESPSDFPLSHGVAPTVIVTEI